MKILFVHTRYLTSRGGEDTTVEAEAALLKGKGHAVEMLFFENTGTGKNPVNKARTAVKAVYNRSSAKRLREKLSTFRPDIIHLHNFFFEASPAIISEASRAGIPIILTIQNYRLICANALLLRNGKVCELCISHKFPWYGVRYKCYHGSALESAVVGAMAATHKITGTWRKKVSAYITPSEFIKWRLVHSSLNLPDSKVFVKRNFIEDPGEGNKPDRKDYYLFVGRLSEEKGVDYLLQSFSQSGSRLVVAGDGPRKEALVQQFGHLQNIQFAGQLGKSEVINLMKQCRALVFPSIWYEGAPLTLTEAFATGTPAIASRLGAMAEMVKHDINGLHFEPGSVDGLQQAIAKMNELVQKGDFSFYLAARQTYLDTYHPDTCYEAIMKIYTSIIHGD